MYSFAQICRLSYSDYARLYTPCGENRGTKLCVNNLPKLYKRVT